MGPVEGHPDVAGAVRDADRRPREPADLKVDGGEQVPGEVGGMLEVAEVLGQRRLDGRLAEELGAQAVPHGDRLDGGAQVADQLDAAAATVHGPVAPDEVGRQRDEHQRWWRIQAGEPSQPVVEDRQQLVEPRPAPDPLAHQVAKVAAAQLPLRAVEPQVLRNGPSVGSRGRGGARRRRRRRRLPA